MAGYHWVSGFGHLPADCRGPGSALEPYTHFKYGTACLYCSNNCNILCIQPNGRVQPCLLFALIYLQCKSASFVTQLNSIPACQLALPIHRQTVISISITQFQWQYHYPPTITTVKMAQTGIINSLWLTSNSSSRCTRALARNVCSDNNCIWNACRIVIDQSINQWLCFSVICRCNAMPTRCPTLSPILPWT